MGWGTPVGSIRGPAGTAYRKTRIAVGNQTITQTAYQDVTNLGFSLSAATDHQFFFSLWFLTAAANTGIGFQLTGPALGGVATYSMRVQSAAAAYTLLSVNGTWSTPLLLTAGPGSSTAWTAEIWGTVRLDPGVIGTMQLQARTEIANSGVTLLYNSSALCFP